MAWAYTSRRDDEGAGNDDRLVSHRLLNWSTPSYPVTRLTGWISGGYWLVKPNAKNPHSAYFIYYNNNAGYRAVGSGRWKLILPHEYTSILGQPRAKVAYLQNTKGEGRTGAV